MRDFISDDEKCRKLMIGVLATQIQDYLYAKQITNNIEAEYLKSLERRGEKRTGVESRRATALQRGFRANLYLFDNSIESEFYVFGFKFICRYIGLDPEKFRSSIRALRMDNIWAVRERIKSYN